MNQLSLYGGAPTSISRYIATLKANNEDFEWFPTTQQMLDKIASDIQTYGKHTNRIDSVLDVGAGDGRVLTFFRNKSIGSTYYAIEKAVSHTKHYPQYILLAGVDFHQTTLMDKDADVLFCNPPYSEFEDWVCNIIYSAPSKVMYFIIPERWQNNAQIKKALEARNLSAMVILEDDFYHADRAARAKVNIVRVWHKVTNNLDSKNYIHFWKESNTDPFDTWFDETFPELTSLDKTEQATEESKQARMNEIFAKTNKIDELVSFYEKDLALIYNNYRQISLLNSELFKELNISLEQIKANLKEKMAQLKRQYWNNFVNNYEPITSRLTRAMRDRIHEKIINNSRRLEFNVANAYAITERLIHIAEEYTEEQFKWFYNRLSKKENIENYKSNQRVFIENDWRYSRDKSNSPTHYKLNYRIILQYFGDVLNFDKTKIYGYRLRDELNDIVVIARTLGLNVNSYQLDSIGRYDHPTGEKIEIFYHTNKGEQVLFDIKFFKNGNCHIRLGNEFALRLNVMAGKLFGWVRSAKEFADETGHNLADVENALFASESSLRLTNNTIQLLGYDVTE